MSFHSTLFPQVSNVLRATGILSVFHSFSNSTGRIPWAGAGDFGRTQIIYSKQKEVREKCKYPHEALSTFLVLQNAYCLPHLSPQIADPVIGHGSISTFSTS